MESNAVRVYTADATPEMAKRVIDEHNHRNRSIRWNIVKKLSEEMKRGRFVNNGDPIRFDKNGELLDGQHRLAAVVDSGCTLKNQLFVCNLDPDVMATIDTGAKRRLSDQLKINGVANAVVVGAAARICVCIEHGDLGLTYNFPDSEFSDFARIRESEIQTALKEASRICTAVGGAPAVYTAGLFYAMDYDKTKTKDFVKGVASGEELKKGDPALTFRNYALRNYVGGRRGRAPARFFQLQILIKALNAHLQGRSLGVLRWGEGESYQRLFFMQQKKERQAVPSPLAELLEDKLKK